MAAAAEAWDDQEAIDFPMVIVVPDMETEELARARAERLIRFAGSVAVEAAADTQEGSRYPTLMDAIHAARSGDETAQRFVAADVRADIVERALKAGHVMPVELATDGQGRIMQHDQLMLDVYSNSLRFGPASPEIRTRTEQETYNGVRLDLLRRMGLLDEYYFVVFSCCPDDMNDEEAEKIGFFMGTRTCAIQTVSQVSGELIQETAFVAGASEEGAARHDLVAVVELLAELGAEPDDTTATGLLGRPLLIHRSLMPDGVIDLVRLYDEHAGGTFFGLARPPQDYLAYLELCRQRQRELEPTAQAVVGELLEESAQIRTPLDAVRRLHELSQDALVMRAFNDTAIDPRVFGTEAAMFIEEGRQALERNDTRGFLEARSSALVSAQSFSCPAALIERQQGRGAADGDAQPEVASTRGEIKKMACPFCSKSQYGDPCAANQYCSGCGATVRHGRIISRGNGGQQAAVGDSVLRLFVAKPRAPRPAVAA